MNIDPLIINPGIQRDDTVLTANSCVDGQWVRFKKGPTKIGGYRLVQDNFAGLVRSTTGYNKAGFTYIVGGSSNFLESLALPQSGASGVLSDRTPTVDFVSSLDNVWSFGVMYNSVGTNQVLVAHAAPNLSDLSSSVAGQIFYGQDNDTTALISISAAPDVTGGIVVLHPYLMAFGDDGLLAWCKPNDPTDWTTGGAGEARIASTKLIKGVPVRGGAQAPAGLFWSLESLYRVSFIGGAAVFRSDFIGNTSLLSTSAVVEYNGLYFFPSIDKFNVYNGTLQEVRNTFNKDHFFDNLNYTQRQKVWGYALPRYNEIWWFWPKGNATECSHYIVYDIEKQVWYDGELSRCSGWVDNVFKRPLAFEPKMISGGVTYPLWEHEFGVDETRGPQVNAIPSFFETGVFSNLAVDKQLSQGNDGAWVHVEGIEPDFIQVGDLEVTLTGRETGNSPDDATDPISFTSTENFVNIRQQRRQPRLRFSSNSQGGLYETGIVLVHSKPGDRNFTK